MRSIQMNGRFWRAFVVVGLVLGGFAYGCGRTSLDDGFGPADGAATGAGGSGMGGKGAGGSGAGGKGTGGSGGVSGQGGIGAGSILTCGTSTCLVGAQACCTPIDRNGRSGGQPYCIDNSDPQGCNGAVICSVDIMCPKTAPRCCVLQQLGVGACFAAGFPCQCRVP